MSSISIETKKVTDLTAITTPEESDLLLIHDGTGLKNITFQNFVNQVNSPVEEKIASLLFNNAGAHNSIYRGKNLGTSVTFEQWEAIAAGTFDNMYIGDYWVINDVTYRIAAFDYYYKTGNVSCETHHVTLVPDRALYKYCMNSSNVTTGGYYGSKMYSEGLVQAKTTINSAFGESHILNHKQFLSNAVTDGIPSACSWYDSTVELMNEQNVYGSKVFTPTSDGLNVPSIPTIDKSQYPLFAFNPYMQSNKETFWLRDVVSNVHFAYVSFNGHAYYRHATYTFGVRPAFSVVGSINES